MKESLKPHNEWLRRISTGDISVKNKTSTSSSTSSVSAINTYTIEEVAKHNLINDAWMIISGHVFDVTEYIPYHPGGVQELMRGVGKDATKLIQAIHPWVNLGTLLDPCHIGIVSNINSNNNNSTTDIPTNYKDYILPCIISLSSLSISSTSSTNSVVSISLPSFAKPTIIPDNVYRTIQSKSLVLYYNSSGNTTMTNNSNHYQSNYSISWYPHNHIPLSIPNTSGINIFLSVSIFIQLFSLSEVSSHPWSELIIAAFQANTLPFSINLVIDTIGYDTTTNPSIINQCELIFKQYFIQKHTNIDTIQNKIQHHITLLTLNNRINDTVQNKDKYTSKTICIHQLEYKINNLHGPTNDTNNTNQYLYWNKIMEELLVHRYILAPHAEVICILYPDMFNNIHIPKKKNNNTTSILHTDDDDDKIDSQHFTGIEDKSDTLIFPSILTNQKYYHNQHWIDTLDTVLRDTYYLANNILIQYKE